jgi:hypothetical protein
LRGPGPASGCSSAGHDPEQHLIEIQRVANPSRPVPRRTRRQRLCQNARRQELRNACQRNGVVSVHPFTGASGPGLLIDFDFDKPQAKFVPTGQILVIGTTPAGPLYIEDFIPDPNFPAFSRCPNFDF